MSKAAKQISPKKLDIECMNVRKALHGALLSDNLLQARNVSINAVSYEDGILRLLAQGIGMAGAKSLVEELIYGASFNQLGSSKLEWRLEFDFLISLWLVVEGGN
jgi:hypothetical protein